MSHELIERLKQENAIIAKAAKTAKYMGLSYEEFLELSVITLASANNTLEQIIAHTALTTRMSTNAPAEILVNENS